MQSADVQLPQGSSSAADSADVRAKEVAGTAAGDASVASDDDACRPHSFSHPHTLYNNKAGQNR